MPVYVACMPDYGPQQNEGSFGVDWQRTSQGLGRQTDAGGSVDVCPFLKELRLSIAFPSRGWHRRSQLIPILTSAERCYRALGVGVTEST